MISYAKVINQAEGVIEVVEELTNGKQFSYYQRDGKFLGSRFEPTNNYALSPTPQ